METKLTKLQWKLQFKELQLTQQPQQKRIQGLFDDKYLHWIENKSGHIEKNGRPRPKCQHHVFVRIFYIVMDDERHSSNIFPNIDYFFMKE